MITTSPQAIRGPRALPSLAGASILAGAGALFMALAWAPADANQGELVRIMYVHVPAAWLAYLSFVVVFLASVAWLWGRWPLADAIAVGSIWAKPTWGVWWTWEPRLITTAVMFAMYAGYLILRSLSSDFDRRATRSAVVGAIAVLNVPIVHLSVTWMNALHQLPSVLRPGPPALDSRMYTTLLVAVIAFTVLYAYLMVERVHLERSRHAGA